MKNYYQIIGVNSNADFATIKNEYLRKMKKYHPDVYVGDKAFAMQKTAELNEAYNVLKDKNLREQYNLKINIVAKQPQNSQCEDENVFKDFWKKLKSFFLGLKSDLVNFGSNHKKSVSAQKTKKQKKNLTQEQIQSKKDLTIRTIIILALICLLVGVIVLLNLVS